MSVVTTVRGDIDPAELGYTSMHEHLNADLSLLLAVAEQYGAAPVPPEMLELKSENLAFLRDGAAALSRESFTAGDVDFTTAELGFFAGIGGRAVVDPSPIGLRGDAIELRTASERSNVHVITATGLYVGYARPAEYAGYSEDDQVALFTREVTEGIGDTGIRPGILKCGLSATDPTAPLSDVESTTLRALARISADTGLSVNVHTAFPMSVQQVAAAVDLLRGGYGSQIVLGHDTTSKPQGKSYGGWGYTRFGLFVPGWLTRLGFDDDVFTKLVVDNPARILAH